jgi:hypothetical protein
MHNIAGIGQALRPSGSLRREQAPSTRLDRTIESAHTLQVGAREVGVAEVRARQVDIDQLRILQLGARQIHAR